MITSSLASKNELISQFLNIPEIGNLLFQELRLVSFEVNQVLYEQGDKIDYLYFPLDCVTSSLAIMEDGTTIETSMVGCESVVGMSTILGSGRSRQWVWVTADGTALQLETTFLNRLLVNNEAALKALLHSYRALITQISQRCVCNTRHTILERLCCWLLMIHDRAGRDGLTLTQELIASRVGARRAGITVAAGMLQAMKAIEYRRGHLHISEREVLERTVCECYNLMNVEGKFIPPPSQISSFDLFAIKKNATNSGAARVAKGDDGVYKPSLVSLTFSINARHQRICVECQ